MKGAGIVGILAIGIASGAVLPGSHLLLSLMVVLTAGTAAACLGASCRDLTVYAMVFLAGLCRGMQWKLTGGSSLIQDSQLIGKAFDGLRDIIHGTGLSDEAEPLVTALVSGDRSDIAPEVKSAFRRSGASHILALSGMHLGIIYGIISKILGLAGGHPVAARIRSMLIIGVCGIYAAVTGAGPSITRAFLFILLREIASMTGRSRNPLTIFTSALAIHLLISPGSVTLPGFQLSYLAMCGIYILYPRLDALYPAQRRDPVRKIWSLACLSISCQAFTAPAAWFHFRSFPRWFLLTNMIAMPLASLLMVTAVTSIALSAAGFCPAFMVRAVNMLAHALIWSLSTVSGM